MSKPQQSIIDDDIRAEADSFFSSNGKIEHAEVLREILDVITPVDFRARADLTDPKQNLPQKHQLVICIDELLAVVKANNFDLARKNDFIFVFNGEFWKELNRETLKDFLFRVAEKQGIDELEAKSFDFRNKLFQQFQVSAYFEAIEPNNEKTLINLQNGTFEITARTQSLRNFQSGDFLTYQLPFDYDQNATCPIFEKYLNEVLPEKELQDIIAEFFGFVFTKNLKIEKALLLYGGGANGKSVLFDVMNALLGKENIANFSLSHLLEEHNRALIAHKLLNYGSEINASKTKDEFKQLVSNEPIQARLKYGQSFTMEKYAKLAFNSNELPKDIEQSHAYFRRLLIVPFRVTVPEQKQDKTLAQKIIKTELSGIFNWILDGLKRLLKNEDFTPSDIVKKEIQTYQLESDSVALFIDEKNYKQSVSSYISLDSLYIEYKDFCSFDGYRSVSKRNFRKRLEVQQIRVVRHSSGNVVFVEC